MLTSDFFFFIFAALIEILCSLFRVNQEDTSTIYGNKDPLCLEGMADCEVERRLKVVHPCCQP